MAKIKKISEQLDPREEIPYLRFEIKRKVNEKLSELENDPDFIEALKKTGPFGWRYNERDREGISYDINIGASYKIH